MRSLLVIIVAIFCISGALADCSCEAPQILWFNVQNTTIYAPKGLTPAIIEFTVDDDNDLLFCEFDVKAGQTTNTFTGCKITDRVHDNKQIIEATGMVSAGKAASVDWSVTDLYVEDVFHNGWELHGDAVMTVSHGNTQFNVKSTEETENPKLLHWGMPSAVDVTDGSVPMSIKFAVQAGVSGFASAMIDYHAKSETTGKEHSLTMIFMASQIARLSETEFEAPFTFERGQYPGIYHVEEMASQIQTNAGRFEAIGDDDFKAINASLTITVTGPVDDEAPELVDFDIQPRVVDVAKGSAVVHLRVTLRDNLRVRSVQFQGHRSNLDHDQTPDNVDLNAAKNCAVGFKCNDTYAVLEYKLTVAAHTPSSTWYIPDHADAFKFSDYSPNIVKMTVSDLKARGFPTSFEIHCDKECAKKGDKKEWYELGAYIGLGVVGALAIGITIFCCIRKKPVIPALQSQDPAYNRMQDENTTKA